MLVFRSLDFVTVEDPHELVEPNARHIEVVVDLLDQGFDRVLVDHLLSQCRVAGERKLDTISILRHHHVGPGRNGVLPRPSRISVHDADLTTIVVWVSVYQPVAVSRQSDPPVVRDARPQVLRVHTVQALWIEFLGSADLDPSPHQSLSVADVIDRVDGVVDLAELANLRWRGCHGELAEAAETPRVLPYRVDEVPGSHAVQELA